MKIIIFQPPYPAGGTHADAAACIQWMQRELEQLQPGEQDLVLLPEYASTPGIEDPHLLREFAAVQGADFIEAVAGASRHLQALIALACPIRSGSRWFNRTLVFNEIGALAFTYDKIHLTGAEKEDFGLHSGPMPTVFKHGKILFGFATCFDLYFPEHFALLAAQGVDLILCPSYQRSESAARIRTMAQVRALDSGTYLLRSSYARGRAEIAGRSLVAAPDGTLLKDAGSDACTIKIELDPHDKFSKPASHGRALTEHRKLMESKRRPALYRPQWEQARQLKASPFPRLCAHRGLSQTCPENTLPALAAAQAVGAHEIEFDVQTSRDGVLVICHDESLDRTTNGRGIIAEMDWEDIRHLDAGSPCGLAWSGIRVPRLEEVLDLTGGGIGLNIHIKSEGPEGSTIRKICDLLEDRGLGEHAYLALGAAVGLQTALDYAPEISRACLVSQNDPYASIEAARRYACQRIQFGRSARREHIQRARELGLICNLFWSDEPADGLKYIRQGIDVILTNRAHIMIAGGFAATPRDFSW